VEYYLLKNRLLLFLSAEVLLLQAVYCFLDWNLNIFHLVFLKLCVFSFKKLFEEFIEF